MKPSDTRFPYHDYPDPAPKGPLLPDDSRALTSTPAHRPSRYEISPLQAWAWTVANMGYGVPDGTAYRAHALDLYEEDTHERIAGLFARLDAQNAEIDAMLPSVTR